MTREKNSENTSSTASPSSIENPSENTSAFKEEKEGMYWDLYSRFAIDLKDVEAKTKKIVKSMVKQEFENFNKKEFSKFKKETEDDLEKTKDDAKNYQLKIIETLGIFVALFTFVSVEFQIFRGIDRLDQAIALSLILLGSLGMFLSLLSYCVGRFFNQEEGFKGIIFIISALLIMIGIFKADGLNFNYKYIDENKNININNKSYGTTKPITTNPN